MIDFPWRSRLPEIGCKNHELKNAINARLPDADPYYVNMAIWHLYELLRERDGEQKQQEVANHLAVESHKVVSPQIPQHSPVNAIYFGPPGTGRLSSCSKR